MVIGVTTKDSKLVTDIINTISVAIQPKKLGVVDWNMIEHSMIQHYLHMTDQLDDDNDENTARGLFNLYASITLSTKFNILSTIISNDERLKVVRIVMSSMMDQNLDVILIIGIDGDNATSLLIDDVDYIVSDRNFVVSDKIVPVVYNIHSYSQTSSEFLSKLIYNLLVLEEIIDAKQSVI